MRRVAGLEEGVEAGDESEDGDERAQENPARAQADEARDGGVIVVISRRLHFFRAVDCCRLLDVRLRRWGSGWSWLGNRTMNRIVTAESCQKQDDDKKANE